MKPRRAADLEKWLKTMITTLQKRCADITSKYQEAIIVSKQSPDGLIKTALFEIIAANDKVIKALNPWPNAETLSLASVVSKVKETFSDQTRIKQQKSILPILIDLNSTLLTLVECLSPNSKYTVFAQYLSIYQERVLELDATLRALEMTKDIDVKVSDFKQILSSNFAMLSDAFNFLSYCFNEEPEKRKWIYTFFPVLKKLTHSLLKIPNPDLFQYQAEYIDHLKQMITPLQTQQVNSVAQREPGEEDDMPGLEAASVEANDIENESEYTYLHGLFRPFKQPEPTPTVRPKHSCK